MSLVRFKGANHPQQIADHGPDDEIDDRGTTPEFFEPLNARLLPANRTEQAWWQELVEPFRDRGADLTTEFVRGRLRFIKSGATKVGPNERPPFGVVLLRWEAA